MFNTSFLARNIIIFPHKCANDLITNNPSGCGIRWEILGSSKSLGKPAKQKYSQRSKLLKMRNLRLPFGNFILKQTKAKTVYIKSDISRCERRSPELSWLLFERACNLIKNGSIQVISASTFWLEEYIATSKKYKKNTKTLWLNRLN